MDSELDRTLNYWDVQSCAEFEQMLDSREDDEEAYAQWVESKACEIEAHGKEF